MERGPDPHLNPPTSSPSELHTRGLLRRSFDEFLMKEDSVVEKCGYQGSQKMQFLKLKKPVSSHISFIGV